MFDYITKHYRAVVAGVRAATVEFSYGFSTLEEREATLRQAREEKDASFAQLKKFKKNTKAGSVADYVRRRAQFKVNVLTSRIQKFKDVGSLGWAFKCGHFCRRPFASIKSIAIKMYKKFMSLSTMKKVSVIVGSVVGVSFLTLAASVVGVTTLCVSSATAALSIAFSRYVFIRNGIAGWIETIVDVMLFALCAVVTYYIA